MTTPPEPPPPSSLSTALNIIGRCFTVVVILALLAPFLVVGSFFIPGPLTQDGDIVIAHGTGVAEIGEQLASEHAIYSASLFYIAARVIGGGSLKAGEYDVPAHSSMVSIVLMMHEGHSIIRLFTVAEGLTSYEIVHLLNADPVLTGSIDTIPAEGSLLPETYRYSYGDSRAGLVARMQKSMQEKINEAWASREAGLPLQSPHEAVVLASIVEKETGKPDERPRIAGVFYNRLRMNMRLQSDPTVIYAITGGKEAMNHILSHEDLTFASPINTYTSDGLPPQPICNPGFAAMEAVLHPEHNSFLYFVADGTGGHAFAADLATHNENINRWHQALDKANRQ